MNSINISLSTMNTIRKEPVKSALILKSCDFLVV